MVNRVIQKTIDIYQYPKEFEGNSGSVTIGDLHGNAVKLVHFLLRQDVIQFKAGVENPAELYAQFVNLYDKMGAAVETLKYSASAIKTQQDTNKGHEKKIARHAELSAKAERTPEEEKELESINPDQYREFISRGLEKIRAEQEAIENSKNLLPVLLDEFHQFLAQIEVKDKNALVRLIGDELADRGSNDYFTLRLLELLNDNGVKVHITISNHSNEFVTAYENLLNNLGLKAKEDVSDPDKLSFLGLRILLEQGLVQESQITDLVQRVYKPTLKVIDYTLSDEGITLFSHAPVRFDVIEHIANKFGVVYDDSTKEALAATIDKINVKFSQAVAENRINELCDTSEISSLENMTPEEIAASPLVNVIWNRWSKEADTEDARPSEKNGYKIGYNHGHDPYQSQFTHVNNLDTACGKGAPRQVAKKLADAQTIVNSPTESQLKKDAQAYIDSVNCYKVLDSDERSVAHQFTPEGIDKEFKQKNQSFFANLFDKVAQVAKSVVDGIAKFGQGLWDRVKETVSNLVNPDAKEKPAQEALGKMKKEVQVYNSAKDRLELFLGGVTQGPYSSAQIKADMAIMSNAAANIKAMEISPEVKALAKKYEYATDMSKLNWAAYAECEQIKKGELTHDRLFQRLDVALDKIAQKQKQEPSPWVRAQPHERHDLVVNQTSGSTINVSHEVKDTLNIHKGVDVKANDDEQESVSMSNT
ncbi:Dot/Icm T4SS effector Wip [Legionella saoudiensis]|uniref:Dot/Icm T4SS effector Wip n=1 Tax=Legionella saoudiensis TaxID=1750561 RepID=UPI000730AE93|nr:Dot/Icm T4SS effector Wip [Legionella saoudiensis]